MIERLLKALFNRLQERPSDGELVLFGFAAFAYCLYRAFNAASMSPLGGDVAAWAGLTTFFSMAATILMGMFVVSYLCGWRK